MIRPTLDDVTVAYDGCDAVSGVSIELEPGKITALVGPNGSGKSTLLRAIADLHRPREGAVLLDGRAVTSMPARELARTLSFLPQTPLIPEGITVRELVEYGRYPHRGAFGRPRPEDREAVDWALEVTDTVAFAPRPVDQLSGGERQRAWIAMALAQRTQLLLLDEPTTYLDIRYQVEVLDLVRGLVDSHGLTVVLVLHDLNQAAAYADQMVLLHEGTVAGHGRPATVLDRTTISQVFGLDVAVETDAHTGIPTCHFYRSRVLASA